MGVYVLAYSFQVARLTPETHHFVDLYLFSHVYTSFD